MQTGKLVASGINPASVNPLSPIESICTVHDDFETWFDHIKIHTYELEMKYHNKYLLYFNFFKLQVGKYLFIEQTICIHENLHSHI